MSDTIFDKILRKEIPSECVYEDDFVYAFKDIRPKAPIHVLVIPKEKIERFSDLEDLDPQFVGVFMQKVARVARELGLKEEGYRVAFNNGLNGGQEVEYIHAHIFGGKRLSFPNL